MKTHIWSTVALTLWWAILAPCTAIANESSDGLWSVAQTSEKQRSDSANLSAVTPAVYTLNLAVLNNILADADAEGTRARGEGVRISIPNPYGDFQSFRIQLSSVMAPELAKKFPEIATYMGQGITDSETSVRFSNTPLGFQATVVGPDGVFVVAPESRGDTAHYVVTRINGSLDTMFQCLVDAFTPGTDGALDARAISGLRFAPSGDELRIYRLAVAATGEYTEFIGSQAMAMASIATTINGINAIYEVEVAVRLILVADNDQIIYPDPDTDPFPLANKNAETQAAIDDEIGDGNYDIGHLFHKEGSSISGNAGCIGCVCTTGSKGSAWSQGPDPTNGNFLFVVAHEMGHQHGGRHTFNGTGCPAGAYSAGSSWEPGSGTTIMSYSSICGADNVLGNQVGDLYFHAGSRQEITAYTQPGGGGACGTASPTGNGIPSVDAGLDYTIPRETPFELSASGSDPNGDALTYAWEQFDLDPARMPLSAVDNGMIPLFRSRPATASTTRTFPDFDDLLAGAANLFPNKLGEQLATTDRMVTFRVTVRDNRAGGGGADDDDLVLTVVGDPFRITAPLAGEGLECNAPSDILWDVGGGNTAANVDVLVSVDAGSSFPNVLASNAPNNGALQVVGPGTLTNDARLRINSIDNVFFALSEQIAVSDTLAPTVTCPEDAVAECTGNNGTDKTDPALAEFFSGASANDACDATVTPGDDAPAFLPLGDNTVTFSASDDSGNTGACMATVSVVDSIAPTISVSVTPDRVFPPNHKMVNITATVVAEDSCDPNPVIRLASVTSNEPENGEGDGNTAPDIIGADVGTEDYSFSVRAERSGKGNGRIYTATYTVTDGSGNVSEASATIKVPRSRGKK